MVIATVSRTITIPSTQATNPFVRSMRFSYQSASWWTTIGGTPFSLDDRPLITSCLVGYIPLTQVDTLAECVATEGSWYYDQVTLTIHFDHDIVPEGVTIQYGRGRGFCDRRVVYIDATEYLPLINSVPKISLQEDIRGYSKLAFVNGSLVLANNGGKLDEILTEPIIGNTVTLGYVDDTVAKRIQIAQSDVTNLATFFVESSSFTPKEISLNLQDLRKINKKVPTETYSTTTYPYLSDSDDGKIIPLIYGPVRGAAAVCINDTEIGTTDATYRAGVVLTAISQVWLKVGDTWTAFAISSQDLANGTFTVSGARSGAGESAYECKVDCTGIAVTHAPDIIVDLFARYLGESFTGSFFDTTTWTTEAASLPQVGLIIDKATDIYDVVNQVQNGIYPGFRFEMTADGIKTIKADDKNRAVKYIVDPCEMEDLTEITLDDDVSELYGSITVGYNQDHEAGELRKVTASDYQESVLDLYQIKATADIESLVQTEILAQAQANALALEYSTPARVVGLTAVGSRFFDLGIYDIIVINTDQRSDADLYTGQGHRGFAGALVCKIIEVMPDYQTKKTQIRAIVIPSRLYVPASYYFILTEDGTAFVGAENNMLAEVT